MDFLLHYSKVLMASLDKCLAGTKANMQPEAIHKLRVEIKRLRSYLKLINSFETGNVIKEPAFLRKIFEAAGRIREVQIERKWINRLLRNDKLDSKTHQHLLLNREKEHKLVLKAMLKNLDKTRLSAYGELLAKASAGKDIDWTIRIVKKKYSRIRSRFHRKRIKRKQLHKLRKELKSLFYIMVAFQKFRIEPAFHSKMMAAVEELQNLIGKWHDSKVFLLHLKLYYASSQWVSPLVYSKLQQKFKKAERKLFKKSVEKAHEVLAQDLILT